MDIKLNSSYYAGIMLILSKTYYAQSYAGIIGVNLCLAIANVDAEQ